MKISYADTIKYWYRKTVCECCGTREGVELRTFLVDSTIDYKESGIEPDSLQDPNRSLGLCGSCYEEQKQKDYEEQKQKEHLIGEYWRIVDA